ncbi:hypothetical protein H5410_054591 [Solanum commersonii]|uniref:F-box domain-containing protein n=1 Tax=Solanum commersonii TaxID=4109 RepID=A0A9J5WFD6_SOLCO|nr:hypothetical protein H5410_054591 [Solanum commersonii]
MHEGKLTIRTAKKKKKSIANIEKTNLFKQISISNGEEATKFSRCKQKKKSNQISKGKRMSSDTTEQMDIVCPQAKGNQFNEEIIIEILSKIPARSILQFNCVSKSWKELISNRYFKMKHLDHSKNDQNSNKLLINKKCLDKDDVFNLYCSTLSSVQVVEDEQKLDWPSNCNPEDSVLYCSCDGLVLLAIYNGLDRHLLLWNPSTRESIVLPHPKSRPKYCILAIDLHETCQEITVEIFTLKGGSWKEICKYPLGIHRVIGVKDCGMYSLAFVHGAFHWVGLSSHCCTIVSFNISNEVYGEKPLLEHMCNIYKARFIEYGISVLGGMLCFCSTYFNPWGGMFKLWMMKEYGVKESWIELLTIQGDSNFFIQQNRFICMRMVKCCYAAIILEFLVLSIGHPESDLDYCLNDNMFELYCSTLSSVKVVDDEQKLDWPSNCKPVNSLLYCSCDGLVLLAVINGFDRHLLLLNPSIGESIVLPHPKSEPKYCVCGMGYDATIDDYKILAIDLHDVDPRNFCKYPAGIHRVLGVKECVMYSMAFVHGAFHWVGLSSHCYTIISFNISNNVYREIPLLEQMCNIYEARFIEYGVSVLGGMLCFSSTYYNPWGGCSSCG